MPAHRSHALVVASVSLVGLLALLGAQPFDRTTWVLEVFPVVIALPVLWATYRRFPLTTLLYVCIFLHALVLMIGGAYTYARVPIGFHLTELLRLSRNPYDKNWALLSGLAFVVICVVLAISATYELIEWAAALALGQGTDEFLGTQGDSWDTQSDMFLALIGAVTALLLFLPMPMPTANETSVTS